jgi:Tfp pilus assembly protein PilN
MVQQQEGYRHLRLWLAAFFGVVLIICTLFLIQTSIVGKVDSEVHHLEIRNKVLKQQYVQIQDLKKKQAELTNKTRVLQMLLAKRNFTKFFVELESTMGPGVWFTHVSLNKMLAEPNEEASEKWVDTGYFVVKKPGPKDVNKSIPPTVLPEITLKGFSLNHLDMVEFIRSLDQSPLFFNVNLRHYKTDRRDREKIAFEIHAYLKKTT